MAGPGIGAAFPLARLDAVVFDMDGVVTQTAIVHFGAWKQLFDAELAAREKAGAIVRPFGADDYRLFVDGKPRQDGVRDFLASRGIVLPLGHPDDSPGRATVWGLGNRKDEAFLSRVNEDGVRAFGTTLEFVRRLTAAGRRVAIISASRNASEVLSAAGVLDLFEVKVDGVDALDMRLAGKPDPAIFLEATRRLGATVTRTAIVEDALAGVEAGVRGGFGFVLAVDRTGFGSQLAAAGASLVVRDLGELLLPTA
ncbi:MAG: HAD-IA family hydrolase [Chloroflexi bacterium]|nr:HAD-IA family hydrolase [Chloroflexota bacterium]